MPKLCLLDLDDPIPLAPFGIEKKGKIQTYSPPHPHYFYARTHIVSKKNQKVLTLSKDEDNVTKGSKGDGNAQGKNDPFPVHQFGFLLQ